MLKEFVKERLMAAADEIFGLFERTIASYEEELSRTKEEKERYRQQLEAVGKNEIVLPIDDVQQLIGHQEERQGGSSALKQEDSQPPDLKEEKGELCITQESLPGLEEDALTKLPPVGVSVKTEDHEDKPPESSQLHHSSGEENRGPEPSSSSSPQRTTAEAGGDYCGGSQADNLLAPLSDCEAEDGDDTKEFLSSTTDCEVDMRAHTDGKGNKERQRTWCRHRPTAAPRGCPLGIRLQPSQRQQSVANCPHEDYNWGEERQERDTLGHIQGQHSEEATNDGPGVRRQEEPGACDEGAETNWRAVPVCGLPKLFQVALQRSRTIPEGGDHPVFLA
ncbi:uncharacterized protein LOC129179580 isoform X3 [Dunckerocampus dactyliophorus]|uniref:uncharacterized protein LOC129179580 isoform X3 n=1 Tax=Dunckerocampus dactyliophorus TaxID=161453 RepID=UPI0024059FDB|nr:uncharacterized protein LOC129179580 isoform X3 [Dunckerocampus dactyliophorus]